MIHCFTFTPSSRCCLWLVNELNSVYVSEFLLSFYICFMLLTSNLSYHPAICILTACPDKILTKNSALKGFLQHLLKLLYHINDWIFHLAVTNRVNRYQNTMATKYLISFRVENNIRIKTKFMEKRKKIILAEP